MKISCCWMYAISKYGYPPSIDDTFRALDDMARLGFTFVELEGVREENMMAVYQHRHDFRQHAENLGLRFVNFCPVLPDVIDMDLNRRRQGLDLFDKAIETAVLLGCETIQLDSFTPPLRFVGEAPYKEAMLYGLQFQVEVDPDFSWPRFWDGFIEIVSTCNARAKAAGLKMTIEPRVGETVSNTDALLRVFDAVQDDNLGAVLDTAHLHAQKEILPLSVEKLGRRIYYVHAADNDSKTNEHRALGEGTVDWKGLIAALKKQGFDGYLAVDIGQVSDPDRDYAASKTFLEQLLAGKM
jgi:sugar phosphate isomerase/epimerase